MAEKKETSIKSKNDIPQVLLSQKEAAEYLGTTVGTLNSWRCVGKNPIPFVRWGNRIRYCKADLDAWISSQTQNKVEGE